MGTLCLHLLPTAHQLGLLRCCQELGESLSAPPASTTTTCLAAMQVSVVLTAACREMCHSALPSRTIWGGEKWKVACLFEDSTPELGGLRGWQGVAAEGACGSLTCRQSSVSCPGAGVLETEAEGEGPAVTLAHSDLRTGSRGHSGRQDAGEDPVGSRMTHWAETTCRGCLDARPRPCLARGPEGQGGSSPSLGNATSVMSD